MATIIGVQFQKNGKLFYFDSNGLEVKPGDYVVVDTARGIDLGEVVMGSRDADDCNWHSPLKKAVRIATEQDVQRGRENREKEKEAFAICQKKIVEHKLEMKLVSVEYTFDNSKVLFFFTANGRVDFRSLVKDLASIFKMRIELRQIGVRDEAKMLGGLGPCGRPICCGTFLDTFQPVSIKMAKEQNLSLNPTKISGVCGRLMCCLKYEQEHYENTRKRMPRIGREAVTPDGTGTVTDLNIVKETVFVRLTNGDTSEIREYPLEKIARTGEERQRSENLRKAEKAEADQNGNEETENAAIFVSEGDAAESGVTGKRKDRKRNRDRKNELGKPVRRENPNRNITITSAANPDEHSAGFENKQTGFSSAKHSDGPIPETVTEPAAESGEKSASPWADALQKAMQAISSEK